MLLAHDSLIRSPIGSGTNFLRMRILSRDAKDLKWSSNDSLDPECRLQDSLLTFLVMDEFGQPLFLRD